MDLSPLIAPRSIAIIGASEEPDSWAPAFYRTLREFGFDGAIAAVNPKHRVVWGQSCAPSLAGTAEPPDLAIIVAPAAKVPEALDDAGRAGARAAMVVASGFAETNDEGARLQAQLVTIANKYGIALLGPNVEGFFNYHDRVGMYAADLPPDLIAGGLTVISHSGAVVWYLAQQASDRAVGLSLAVGVGNGAILDAGDFIEWAAADARTTVIACYLEANRNLASLDLGLRAASKAGKPVIICAPGGRTDQVRRSIAAHTGTLAPDWQRRAAWLKAAGALLVDDVAELFESAVLLLRYRRIRADGVTAAMEAGGDATLFAASAEHVGLTISPLSASAESQLRGILPPFANPTSPLDVTGQCAFDPAMYAAVLDVMVADRGIGVVALDAAPPRGDEEAYWAAPTLKHAAGLTERSEVAIVSILASPLAYSPGAKRYVARSPIPFLHGHRAGARALKVLLEFQSGPLERRSAATPAQRDAVRRLLEGESGVLDSCAAGRILAEYGIASPAQAVADSPEEAASAASALGFPVAVKAISRHIPHKSKAGAVRLHLWSAATVREAADAVLSAARQVAAPDVKVQIQKMIAGTEILVGGIADDSFGPMVTMRPGGQLAEAGDASFHAAPLSVPAAREIVEREAGRCGLGAHQDLRDHVTRALVAMSSLVYDFSSQLIEVEANPLIVAQDGAFAADALAVVRALAPQASRQPAAAAGYRPFGKEIDSGATSGVPTSS